MLIVLNDSNTKVSYFRSYATGVQPFRNIVQTTKPPNAFSVMNKLDQDETCSLHYAADMIKDLTAGLLKMRQVSQFQGEVMSADYEDQVRPNFISLHDFLVRVFFAETANAEIKMDSQNSIV